MEEQVGTEARTLAEEKEGHSHRPSPIVASSGVAEETQRLTAVIMSYPGSSRHHLLMEIVCRLRQWYGLVKEVILVWNGPLDKMPPHVKRLFQEDEYGDCCTASYFTQKGGNKTGTTRSGCTSQDQGKSGSNTRHRLLPIKVLPQSLNRIDNRWRIHESISTQGVLNMDDDINLYRQGAECMFSVFQSSPDSIVGIDVRAHVVWSKGGNGNPPDQAYTTVGGKKQLLPVGYKARDLSQGPKQYSLALPRALLTNKKYYKVYDTLWKDHSSNLRKIVDDTICDDIGFNFVASLVGAHVVYVKAKYSAYKESHDATALTKKDGMKQKRQRCVQEFSQMVPTWSGLLRDPSKEGGAGGNAHAGKDYWDLVPLKYRRWHVLCEVDG